MKFYFCTTLPLALGLTLLCSTVWGQFLYYSAALPGYKWPAIRADNYANTPGAKNRYVGDDPNLVMGSLLAIPPNVTEASLSLTTEVGRKLFFTLQNYGAYITEDPGQDILDLIVERGVSDEVEARYGFSLKSDQWDEEFNKLAAVDLNQTATSDNQHWYLIPAGNDFFYLQNKNCGQRLDSNQCNTIDVGSGTSLAKRWRLVETGAANARTVREERKTTNTFGVQANSLQLYPNPSRGGFTVSTDQAVLVQVIDATGRTVYRSKHASKNHTVDLPDHPNGTYLLRTSTGQTAKFIKD